MSHHIHMLPPLLPLERPLKLNKKRRLRKSRSGEVSYTDEVGDSEPIDGSFLTEGPAMTREDPVDEPTGRSTLSGFSGPTLKALLQAQEEA